MLNDGIAFVRNGHRTLFKWHRGRRQRDDIAFTRTRLLEGMRLGASLEVDINCHRGHGFVVLHDKTLDAETSGSGLIRDTAPEALVGLTLRRDDGALSTEPVLLLDDLLALLRAETLPPGAMLQLDLKEAAAAIVPEVVNRFGRDAAPVARHLILSGGDFEAVTRLASAVPGIGVGYDPCFGDKLDRLRNDRDFAAFIADALVAAPDASMLYLDYRIVMAARKAGFDMIARVHAAGKTVDAWTLNSTCPDVAEVLPGLLELQVDQITTDEPVRLQALAMTMV